MHRDGGPAITKADGTKKWYRDGYKHNTDGPAVIHADGSKEWWENGKRKTPEEEAKLCASWNALNPLSA